MSREGQGAQTPSEQGQELQPSFEQEGLLAPVPVEQQGIRSERARRLFEEQGADRPWLAVYWALRDEGWPWRQAAYIAWAATPVEGRQPTTQERLAREVLGLSSARRIRAWRAENPAIDERVASLLVESLMEARADVIEALKAVASKPEPAAHRDRRLYLEMVGLHRPEAILRVGATVDDLAAMSDEELRGLAARPTEAN